MQSGTQPEVYWGSHFGKVGIGRNDAADAWSLVPKPLSSTHVATRSVAQSRTRDVTFDVTNVTFIATHVTFLARTVLTHSPDARSPSYETP
jgi:hypothetical protein